VWQTLASRGRGRSSGGTVHVSEKP
jgi:hypothetical protein